MSLKLIDQTDAEKISHCCGEIINNPASADLPEQAWCVDGVRFNIAFNRYLSEKSGVAEKEINRCQGADDVFNTAQNIAVLRLISRHAEGIEKLLKALKDKSVEFQDQLHVGRSHMQEALPVTWGAVFGAMYLRIQRCYRELIEAREDFLEVNLGLTPVDPFEALAPGFRSKVISELKNVTELNVRTVPDEMGPVPFSAWVGALEGNDRFVRLVSILRNLALNIARVGNDLYLYSSGPRCGIGELGLPAIAPGSTIMPGKINPSMPELMLQLMHQTMAADQMTAYSIIEEDIDLGASNGCVFFDVAEVLEILGRGSERFVEKCVSGITVKEETCIEHLNHSASFISIARAVLGEQKALQVRQEAESQGISVPEAIVLLGFMTKEEVSDLFDLSKFKNPNNLLESLSIYVQRKGDTK